LGVESGSGRPIPHPRPRPRGGGGRQSQPRADREKTPQPTQDPKPTSPRGSTIANKLGRHAAQAWTNVPIPHHAVHVRTPLPPSPPVNRNNLHASLQAPREAVPARPPTSTTISQRRRLVPRAGSPAYWAPCLVVHPSVHDTSMGVTASCHSDPKAERCSQSTAKLNPLPSGIGSEPPAESWLPPYSFIQAREKAPGIAHLRCCEWKSYSGLLIVHPDTPICTVHCNGRHPSLPEDDQAVIYLMTCTPLSAPEDLKVLIRAGIFKLCPPDLVLPSYEALRFFLSPGEPGTTGLHLLVKLHFRCFRGAHAPKGRPPLPTGLHTKESGNHSALVGALFCGPLCPTRFGYPAKPAHAWGDRKPP